MTKNTNKGEWGQMSFTFKDGVNFNGRPIHNGFHFMGSFQNWPFITSYVHDLLSIDNLSDLADGRMWYVSRLMSGILGISVLEAESGVTEPNSVLSHITPDTADSPLLWLPCFPS